MDKLARGNSEQMESLIEELREKVDLKDVSSIIDEEMEDEE